MTSNSHPDQRSEKDTKRMRALKGLGFNMNSTQDMCPYIQVVTLFRHFRLSLAHICFHMREFCCLFEFNTFVIIWFSGCIAWVCIAVGIHQPRLRTYIVNAYSGTVELMLNCIKRRTGNKRWAIQSNQETGKGKQTRTKNYWQVLLETFLCGWLD